MKKELNLCNLYIVLWLISFFQNMMGAGNMAFLIISIPGMLITIYCFAMMVRMSGKNNAIIRWMFFFFFLIVYGIVAVLKGAGNSFLMMVLSSVGPMISFYYFTIKGYLTEKHLLFWFFVFSISATIGFYNNESKYSDVVNSSNYDEGFTNNISYLFAGLMPFIFLLNKKPLLQSVFLAFLLYFSFIGFKRGAYIVVSLMLIWFVINNMSGKNNTRRWFVILLTVVGVYIGWRFLSEYYSSNDYLQYRVESTLEGNSSGRDLIYSTLWGHFKNETNTLTYLFGGGAFYSKTVTNNGMVAHNDWLELLIDCGILGAMIYLFYWIGFVRDWVKNKKEKLLFCIMGSCFLFTFTRTFFSMSFSDMPFHVNMIMGYCFAISSIKK